MQLSFTPDEIIAIVRPKEIRGSFSGLIKGVAALEKAVNGDLSFLSNAKYREKVGTTQASLIFLPVDFAGEPAAGQCFLIVDNPSLALAQVCARIEQQLWPKPLPGVHPSAVISASAKVSAGAHVGPLCVIEDDVVVGEGTYLQAQVSLGQGTVVGKNCWLMAGTIVAAHCTLGDRVRLQPGAVIGADGFGYEFVAGRHEKVPQIGTVDLGDDVEIGANSTVDRARFSRTVIGEGTKIDNLVQIGHNVIIGKHCILCSQVGVSGSTTIEDYVVLAGQVGVAGHLTIGKGAKVGGQSGIQGDIAPKAYVNGSPARSFMLDRRLYVLQERLPEFFKRIEALEEKEKKSSA